MKSCYIDCLMKKKILLLLAVITAVYLLFPLYAPVPHYEYPADELPGTFEEYYNARLEQSEKAGVKEGCRERLIRKSSEKTEFAVLYIHGFGGCRAEGEMMAEKLADKFNMNTYFLRLPGHGAGKDLHLKNGFRSYMSASMDALRMSQKLGDKVILMSTSMGALLSTWLAAEKPDMVHAVIAASPFYDFADPTSAVLDYPGGMALAELLTGELRDTSGKNNPRYVGRSEDLWMHRQYTAALQHLVDIRDYIVRDKYIGQMTRPFLMVYYFKDENNKDHAASVEAMISTFNSFGSEAGGPHQLNKRVAIEDGSHVMFSEHVMTDKKTILRVLTDFVEKVKKL